MSEEYQRGYEQGVKDFAEKLKCYYDSLKGSTPCFLVSFHIDEKLREIVEKL